MFSGTENTCQGASPWTPSETNREAKSWGVQSWARRRCGGTWPPCVSTTVSTRSCAVRRERRGCGCRSSSASGCWSGGFRSAARRQLGVAEFRELNRIGVNLNQIARALNQRSDVAAPRLDELRRLGELIAQLLER